MRRARIQIKPNIAKAAKQAVPAKSETPAAPTEPEQTQLHTQIQNDGQLAVEVQEVAVAAQLHNHHVHFGDDVVDNEQQRQHIAHNQNGSENVQQDAQNLVHHPPPFASPTHPTRLITPRSRNVSMCEDEAILQPKQPRERKRFTGKEELDTKTWKMSDLTRWNPRNEQTSFKRERRSSTSSTIVTKSEMGDFGDQAPRVNAPQVKIGADGRLVIDESSLVVQSAQINHESVWETVEEGRMSSKITSMSFRSRIFRKPNIWTERETDLFYEVLQCTGQDFGLMHHYLPQRSRVELKAKYNREEKINWPRLLKAISHPVRLDADLEARIARYQFEMEEEIREKKAKCEYEKAEEKRVRAQMREQQALERLEERQKKLQAKELIRQARELEKDAIQAAKCRQIESEKKDRQEAREMAIEAKRIAQEARKIINESRRREKRERKKFENDNLEREAERIIRRLMKESQREERRLEKLAQKKKTAKESRTPVANDAVDPHASGPELGDTTSDSSTTASSSDEDALLTKVAKREKERMKEEKRNLEPRKSVIGKKPIYVDVTDPKYAQHANTTAVVELAKAAHGNMFDSADEQDEFDPAVRIPAPSPLATASPPPVATPPSTQTLPAAVAVTLEEEPIPQAVHDVIKDIVRNRSKTPIAAEQSGDFVEPPSKLARLEENSEQVNTAEVVEAPQPGDSMQITDTVVVETSEQGPSTSKPVAAKRPAARRTVKKPVTWQKKPTS